MKEKNANRNFIPSFEHAMNDRARINLAMGSRPFAGWEVPKRKILIWVVYLFF
jgi:hypothetical protein